MEVAVPAARISSEVEQRLQRISRTARLKGFRPGKAPMAVVRQQFGGEVFAEVVGEVMRTSFAEAVDQEKLRPAGTPRIEPLAMEPGADLRYAALFEVLPEVKLAPMTGVALERPVTTVTDADVDTMIDNMRRQLAQRRAMEAAHAAHCDNPEHDHSHLPQQAGAQNPSDPGELELPAIDEEFCRAFGIHEGGVETLRTEVRKSMEREIADLTRSRLRSQILDALYRENPLELPRALIDEQIQTLQLDVARRAGVRDASQLPPAEQFEEPARRRAALGLLMSELVRREKLEASADDVRARVDEIAASYPNSDEVRRAYLQNPQALRQVESVILEEKVVDWIVQHGRLSDREVSFSELTGFGQSGESESP
jgi:trigger factor